MLFDFETCGLNLGSLRNKPWQLAFITIENQRVQDKADYWLRWDDIEVSEGAAKVTARYVAGAGFLRKVADLPVCESPAGASRSRLARGLPRCGRQAGGRADVTPNFFQTGKCVSFLATDRKKVQPLTASQAFSDVFAQIPVGQFTCATHAPGLAPKRVTSHRRRDARRKRDGTRPTDHPTDRPTVRPTVRPNDRATDCLT